MKGHSAVATVQPVAATLTRATAGFGEGQHSPKASAGRGLLAHELAQSRRAAEIIKGGEIADVSISNSRTSTQRQPNLTDEAAGGCGVCFRTYVKARANVSTSSHSSRQVAIDLRDPKFVALPNGDLEGEIDATDQHLGVQITGAVSHRIGGAK
jgi:hypothetical protein